MSIITPLRPDGHADELTFVDEAAERELLGSLIIDNAALARVSKIVDASQFAIGAHQRIFAEIVALVEKGRRATPITLKAAFDRDAALLPHGGADYLVALTNEAVYVSHHEDYAERIADLAARRHTLEALKNGHSADEFVQELEAVAAKLRQSSSRNGGASWPEPAPILKNELEAAAKFPVEFLPGALADLARDVADRMQCPVDIVGIPLIVGAATAIGKDFRLAPKAFDDWMERACLWGGVILPSGKMKTPAQQKGLRPIRLLESEFHQQYEMEIKQYEVKMAQVEYSDKCWKEACKRAARTGADMPDRPELPIPPRLRRITTSDITQESLVDLIEQNPRGLMLFRDELSGWFASFNQYRPGADRQFFLECHAGGAYPKDRRAGSAWVKDLYLNICGGVQPDVVRLVLAGGDRDGMAARFSLLVYPDHFEGFDYIDRRPDLAAERAVEDLFKKLTKLDPEAFFGPENPHSLRAFRFDDRAQAVFVEWYTKNQHRIRQSNETGGFIAHLSKYAGLFARLAIVHHLCRYVLEGSQSPALVDETTARAVERFIDNYLEPHARRIYQHLGDDPSRGKASRIAEWIVANPAVTCFTARDIRQKDWSGLTEQDDVNRALDYLENVAGWLRCSESLPGPKGGRPTTKYVVNPLVRRHIP